MSSPLKLGVSACLLGQLVRYDGQHKHDRFLTETLGKYVDFIPVCPEVECGLPVPREAMRLVGSVEAPRLMTQRTGIDLTDQMLSWAACRVNELKKDDLCGFIFKSKSPSSGMERVKVYNGRGGLSGHGAGLFAKAFMTKFPLLPVEEEGRLHDANLRQNFIERIFTLKRYREATAGNATRGALMRFHEQHKFLIMSHSQDRMRKMGRMLADSKGRLTVALRKSYEDELLQTLKLHASVKKHVNVIQHMLGFVKEELNSDEKVEILELLEQFRDGLVPMIVPMTMLRHYVRKYDVEYLATQYYLNPNPLELSMLNHA